jgi:pilus assembly protein CpaE
MSSEIPIGPKERIKVLVIPGQDPVGDWIADVVKSERDMGFLASVRDLSRTLETIEKTAPDVVLVDLGSGILQQPELLEQLAAPMSGSAVIVVAMLGEVDMVRQAMLHGAQGFLLKPFSEAELLGSIRQAYELIAHRRAELAVLPRVKAQPKAEPVAKADIVVVYSPKGGVGTTTLAINLAVALKAVTGLASILVDADLRFGDVDTALNITSATSIGSLVSQLDQLDNQLLDRSLITHGSGIKVVVAPPHLDVADSIRPENLKQLLLRLSELEEGYVVVDAWSSLDDTTLAMLDVCQHLVVVTTPQVTALRDVHRFLEVLDLLSYDPGKTVLVLNHCYHRSDIGAAEVERALGHPVAQTIQYAPREVTTSLNRGAPLVQEYGDSQAARSITRLAQLLAERSAQQESQSVEGKPVREKEAKAKRRGLFSGRKPVTA